MESKDNRPWYRKKTNLGLIVMSLGAVMQVIPVTALAAPMVYSVGTILAGYGVADRISKK